ncbi:MAG: hypothetical protein ABI854_03490 [Betaproteobacteria bacterium]
MEARIWGTVATNAFGLGIEKARRVRSRAIAAVPLAGFATAGVA